MVVIHIYTDSIERAKQVANALVEQKYALFWNITQNAAIANMHEYMAGNYILHVPTRATLYNDVEAFLDKTFPEFKWFLYSTPIVNQPKHVVDKLKAHTQTGLPVVNNPN